MLSIAIGTREQTVIQTGNDCKKELLNGYIGTFQKFYLAEREVSIQLDDRLVPYDFGEVNEASLAYA